MREQANNFMLPVFHLALPLCSLSLHPRPLGHPHHLHHVKKPKPKTKPKQTTNNKKTKLSSFFTKKDSIYIISVKGRKESKSPFKITHLPDMLVAFLCWVIPLPKVLWGSDGQSETQAFSLSRTRSKEQKKNPKLDRNDVKQCALKLFCFFEEKRNSALVNPVSEYLSCFYRTLLSLCLL